MLKRYRQQAIKIGISASICIFITLVYELWLWLGLLLFLCIVLCLPLLQGIRDKREYEQLKFSEMTAYMEQMICSYKRTGQAVTALIEAGETFSSQSRMGRSIRNAIQAITTGQGIEGDNILREGLRLIEKSYEGRRLVILHSVICSIEKNGGRRDEAMDILLEDLQMYRRRIALFEKKRKYIRTETVISIVMSAVMCYVSKLLTPKTLGISLADSVLYQMGTLITFVLFLVTFVFVQKRMTASCVDCKEERLSKELQEKYYLIVKNEYLEKTSWLKQRMANKIIKKEAEQEYPYWMLYLTILLQSESVYVAVKETLTLGSGSYYFEVERFLERLYEAPTSVSTFVEFYRELAIPELQTAMKVLYSIGTNGYEQNSRQLNFLISQNNLMADRVENNRDKERLSGLSLLKNVPMIIACFKLLLDLVNLLRMILQSFSHLV